VIYFDSAYVARLYLEDHGWEVVRELAARSPVACSIHGRSEVVAALHRKHREGAFLATEYRQVLEQFELDCRENAFRWLALSPQILERVTTVYRRLPSTVFLRSSDALHLACAAENKFHEIHSNDQRLLAAAPHFGVTGINVIP
jgi:predicted nucleic acid-binding protein